MRMKLGLETEKTLNYWLSQDTWHTSHSLDMERFYNFLDCYVKEQGYSVDRAELREEISRKVNNEGKRIDHFIEEIEYHLDQADLIIYFLEKTGR